MKQLKSYLARQRYLIADESSTTRVALARCLSELGVPVSQMSLAGSLDWAMQLRNSNPFTVVISEYEFTGSGAGSGLSLIRNRNYALKIVMSKNQTDVAEAESLEQGADVFIKKPFTSESFKGAFLRVVERALLKGKNPIELERSIQSVRDLKAEMRELSQTAYASLISLHDSLLKAGNKKEAYKVLRRVVSEYPVSPDKLNSIFRLAIETRQFEDVEDYYRIFLSAEDKTDSMIRHACAALIMAGKAYLARGQTEVAVDFFRKATITSGKKVSLIAEIVEALLVADEPDLADKFLVSVPEQDRSKPEIKILNYRVLSELQPLHVVLREGRSLLKQGHDDPMVFRILIEACKKAHHDSEAESIAMDASRRWPQLSQDYGALVAGLS